MLFYLSLSMIPIQEAITIIFTCIIWTGIIARILLKEPYSWLDFGSGVVGMVGTILVIKPNFIFTSSNDQSLFQGRMVALACSLVFACINVLLRFLKGVNIFMVSTYNYMFNIFLASIVSFYTKNEVITFREYLIIFLLGFLTYMCQLC